MADLERYRASRRESKRRWRQAHLEEYRAAGRLRARLNYPAVKARIYLNYEIKCGRLPKPAVCILDDGTCYGRFLYHHPNGYEGGHMFEVVPMCARHHKLLHLGLVSLGDLSPDMYEI